MKSILFSFLVLVAMGASSSCRAEAFFTVTLPGVPECDTGFEILSFNQTISSVSLNGAPAGANGAQPQVNTAAPPPSVTVTKNSDACSPRLYEITSNVNHLAKVIISIPKASEQIILSEAIIPSISESNNIETITFEYGSMKIEFGTTPSLEYDFYQPGTKIVVASFRFNGIVRDFSPASPPISGFTGFQTPTSLNPCDLDPSNSPVLSCIGPGGGFYFLFNYGLFPRQPGAFSGNGFARLGSAFVGLSDGQVIAIP
jgi:type VI protein secretion system component Hcp